MTKNTKITLTLVAAAAAWLYLVGEAFLPIPQ